ncbi:hypothetical protein F5Y02DRAFT_423800 [Annulohypoxylon stygium]|nr:hypothetical protein F5Y02DRAFT_423800 [Annulohypoxylon stygium]
MYSDMFEILMCLDVFEILMCLGRTHPIFRLLPVIGLGPATTSDVILGNDADVFFNEAYEKYWWQTLPEAPAVTSLLLKVPHNRAWKPVTLENLVSRIPNLEEFRYKNMTQDSAADAPIHHNPSFSAKRWSRALAYYSRIHEQYFSTPSMIHYKATEFDPLRRPTADD